MLDLYKLRIFTVVAQEGSLSAAADRLYISQSAVSQHIKDLERSLGRPLFQRGRRGVTLTPHGEILRRYARDILVLVARAEAALTDVAHLTEGKVNIGTTPGIAVYLAPEWIQRFRTRYSQLTVALQTGVTGQIVPDVLAGRLDMGLIEGELEGYQNPRLAWRELEEAEQLVVVGRDHAWASRESVRLEELDGQPMIMRQPGSQTRAWLEGALRPRRVSPVVATEFDNLESMKRSAAQGTCLTILPEYVVRYEVAAGQLAAIPIEGQPLRRTLKLIWAVDSFFSPVAMAFLNELSLEYPSLKSMVSLEANGIQSTVATQGEGIMRR
jgi:LysR family transcriptional regulator, low CO2-responsive transcriptional regulator